MSGQLLLGDAQLGAYLADRGILPSGTPVEVEPAGDGNINWVRRVRAGADRSWIVKQARPTLERFPQYSAPTERIVIEHRYFELASKLPEGRVCPRILDFDPDARVLVMEDLSEAERLDDALARGAEANLEADAATLGEFLGAVHATTTDPALTSRFTNTGMQRLHGDHIFALPLGENDFPMAPELRAEADRLRGDSELHAIADHLYVRYLEPRGALLHADVQAGNILLTESGPKLIDAEIAHIGDPAFDLGMLLAHLQMPAVARGEPEAASDLLRATVAAYEARLAGAIRVPFVEAARYAGIEMLRRTIGAARVACAEPAVGGIAVLSRAVAWLRNPPDSP